MFSSRYLSVVSCLVFAACATAPTPIPAFPLAEADGNASVSVRVNVFRHGHGSGVVLSKDGLILACEHTVRHVGRADVVVSISDGLGRTLPATVVATDPTRDLALLKVDATFERVAELAQPDAASAGRRIYGIGYPGSKVRAVARGIITRAPFSVDMRPAEPANFKEGILAEMPAAGGTSGQGVFSAETGLLLGVHKMSFRLEEGDRSVLISAGEIRSFLAENDIQIK